MLLVTENFHQKMQNFGRKLPFCKYFGCKTATLDTRNLLHWKLAVFVVKL